MKAPPTCPGPRCDRAVRVRGMCWAHAWQAKQGRALTPLRAYSRKDGRPTLRGDEPCPCGTSVIYATGLCVRCYVRKRKLDTGWTPKERASAFDAVAEAFRAYWECEGDEKDFQRAKARAAQALLRYGRALPKREERAA